MAHYTRQIEHTVFCMPGGAFGFLLPFEATLWLCTVFTPFVVYIVWWLAAKVTPLGAFTVRRMRSLDQPHARIKEYAIESGNHF